MKNHKAILLFTFLLLGILCSPYSHAGKKGFTLDKTAESYHQCIVLAGETPAKALSASEEILSKAFSTSAQHCKAVALFSMGNYPEAAQALEILIQRISAENAQLRASILEQAALSRQNSGDLKAAAIHLTHALMEIVRVPQAQRNKPMVSLLQRRSAIYTENKDLLRALQDIEHAIALDPRNENLQQAHEVIIQQMGYPSLTQANNIKTY